jgi:hypothetical protein
VFLNSCNHTLIGNEIQGLNQIPKIQSNSFQNSNPDLNFNSHIKSVDL